MNSPAPEPAAGRAFAPNDLRRAPLRLLCGVLAGASTIALLALASPRLGWAVPAVAGWDVASTTFLALSWWIIARADAQETQRRAAAEDPGRNAAWGVVLLASTFSLFGAVVLLRRAKIVAHSDEALLVGLCLVAVVTSWVLCHTAYTLRYAHLHYRDDGKDGEKGLNFGSGPVCPWNFKRTHSRRSPIQLDPPAAIGNNVNADNAVNDGHDRERAPHGQTAIHGGPRRVVPRQPNGRERATG